MILPFVGAPGIWKTYLTLVSGLVLVFYASAPILVKKLQVKTRTRKKITKVQTLNIDENELRFNSQNSSETDINTEENSPQEKDEKTFV